MSDSISPTTVGGIEVVLVEDNPRDAELALRALKSRHLLNNIVHLTDGAQALEFLFVTGAYAGREVHQGPRVVLLDLKLPKVDGLKVLRRLKADPATCRIPVVVMTSSQEQGDVVKSYDLGVNSYIVKPVGFDNFSKVVADVGCYWLLLNHPPP